ncbi:MAG TPA: peptide-methionine (S)-S-oxide reductase MsrA [Ignavibacteria bacterium]|nr:peptide-methionine (S)-S-oxide reductase MsrA [Ignavibacteria bacterium]
MSSNLDTAVFGAGCFWCVEAIFQRLKGVEKIESGYTGGTVPNPTYKQVCTGTTGHAEVARIYFDPDTISYSELLEVFWTTHDPTTLNKQGADVGTQYRSAIFYLNDDQKNIAEKSKAEVAPQIWDQTIVTEITPLGEFYVAEDYHQNYYNQNSDQSYCKFVINPKLDKFRKKFKDKIREE